ncbi:MAG: hypothetical protein QW304_03770 [Thermoproteota archaeon]
MNPRRKEIFIILLLGHSMTKMVLFKKKEDKKEKTKAEKIAEALIDKIGKEKVDDEATKLYFQGVRDFDEQMEILAKKYGVETS